MGETCGGRGTGCDRLFPGEGVYFCHTGWSDALKIYLDLVVILNFLVDFLLLLGTNRLSGFPASPLRAAAAAALGAVYSGVCMMPRMRFLGGLLWRIVSLAGMAVIAFGWDKSAWKRSGVFVLLSMALGGASLSIGHGNFLTLLLTAGGVWALCIVAFGGRVGGQRVHPGGADLWRENCQHPSPCGIPGTLCATLFPGSRCLWFLGRWRKD